MLCFNIPSTFCFPTVILYNGGLLTSTGTATARQGSVGPTWILWTSKASCYHPSLAMDFFSDPNLFVGGLEGLDDDGFPAAPSLVDELNLSADFEPLQMEPPGQEKNQDMMPHVSTQQSLPTYNDQIGHYIGIKAQNPVGQSFSGPGATDGGDGRMIGNQHVQYHSGMHQVPESNGMFCNRGSPMWGNQNQNGNMYHNLSQPPQHQQQLHNHQIHVRQQAQQQHHHPCYQQSEQQHRMRQQQSHHQQLLAQHQQLNTHTIPLQQHHNFSFHQGSHSQSHQQLYHTQPQVQQQLNRPRFQSRTLPSKSYVNSQSASLGSTCLQAPQQQQCSYQMTGSGQTYSGPGPEDHNVLFPMQSSSMVHSLPTRSGGSVTAYQPAQFSSFSAEPDLTGLSQQVLPSVSRPTTNSAPLTCTMPEFSGPGSQFPSTDIMSQQHIRAPARQPEECPFQGLRCSGETQRNLKSSDMFGKSMSCYSGMASPLPSEQPQSCVAISVNGYQALGDSLLSTGAHDGDLDDLEPPDLLPDLLPQLEAALTQQNETKCSWTTSSQERGREHRKPPPEKRNEEVGNIFLHSRRYLLLCRSN